MNVPEGMYGCLACRAVMLDYRNHKCRGTQGKKPCGVKACPSVVPEGQSFCPPHHPEAIIERARKTVADHIFRASATAFSLRMVDALQKLGAKIDEDLKRGI